MTIPARSPRLQIQGDGKSRLDTLLVERFKADLPGFSRQQLKKAWNSGAIRPLAGTAGARLGLSDMAAAGFTLEIECDWSSLESASAPQAAGTYEGPDMPVLFENDSFVVLHKPSGVPSLPHSSEERGTAVNRFLALHPECADLPSGGLEPGLLHRLDTETSGCLAFAKTKDDFVRIRGLWKTKAVRKIYLARVVAPADNLRSLASGLPIDIRAPLGHSAKSSKRMLFVDPRWTEAETRRRLRGPALPAHTRITRVAGGSPEAGMMDLEIEIFTGVQHQIRAHLASLGFPILGDPLYGAADASSARLHLHALGLVLPDRDGQPLEITAPLEKGLKNKGENADPLTWTP